MTLPPLPEPGYWSTRDDDTPLFTAAQMESYARAAIAAHVPEAGCGNIAAVPARTLTDEQIIDLWSPMLADGVDRRPVGGRNKIVAFARAVLAAAQQAVPVPAWQPIETAPRGSGEDGPEMVNDPDYVAPPQLLLMTPDGMTVGAYDWYYHAGYGRGAEPGVPAWRQSLSSEPIYDATHWMPLPAAPKEQPHE